MAVKNKSKEFVPIVLFFVLFNALAISLGSKLATWNVNQDVLIYGNLFLFVITVISFLIVRRGLQHENPNAFMRSVYGSIMAKMFLSIIAAFIYIAINKKGLNKAALFICMGLYLVYMFLEVSVLTRILRQKPNE